MLKVFFSKNNCYFQIELENIYLKPIESLFFDEPEVNLAYTLSYSGQKYLPSFYLGFRVIFKSGQSSIFEIFY